MSMKKYIGITRPINIVTTPNANIDAKYGPYNSIDDAIEAIPKTLREEGLTFGVNGVNGIEEYWWYDGIEDENIINKNIYNIDKKDIYNKFNNINDNIDLIDNTLNSHKTSIDSKVDTSTFNDNMNNINIDLNKKATKEELNNIENNRKGYFADDTELKAAYPNPKVGWYAYVGSTNSIWGVNRGNWRDTQEPIPSDVDLSGYAKIIELNEVKTDLAASQTAYPFKNGITDTEILTLNNFIKYLYVKNRNPLLKYYLSTVLRNSIPGGNTVQKSIIDFYSKTTDGTLVKIIEVNKLGDEGLDGSLKRYTASDGSWDLIVDWSSIPSGTAIIGMAYHNKIELSNEIFIKHNFDTEISDIQQYIVDMKNSVLYKMEFSLTEGGYIDGRTGGVKTAPNFSYTADFLSVKPGQTIHYKGYNYGNSTLCGYSKDKTSFVNLLTTPGSTSLMDVYIVIPDNIYYIRGCTVKVNNSYLLEINPDLNYDFLDKEIIEVIDSQSSDTINNMIQDPYFKYGIMLTAVDPQLIAFGGGVISLSNGEAINKSAATTAKGMFIMARFSQGWATKFGLKPGDTIRVGAYIKAVVGSGSTVTRYGTRGRNDLPADEITYIGTNNSLPLDSYTDWQWIERTLTLKTDGTDIDQPTDFSLGYIQLTDPGAATNPTELRIKQPCILFNPPVAASGFYESKRSQQMDYLFVNFLSIMGSLSIGGDLSVNNLIFNGSQVESTFLTMSTEKAKIRWIELSDNQCFPSVGKFLGLKNDSDLIFCVDGVETKLN